MKASDIIFDYIKKYTDTVFFVAGGGAMHLVDSLGRSGLRYVPCLHEQGAGFAALGYAMQRKGLGVCLVTSGPGSTNALTPCAAAWMDSVPVLFISGNARSDSLVGSTWLRTRGVQEVDSVALAKPITKFAVRTISGRVEPAIRAAVITCLDDRPGPCWLDVPLDIQAEDVNV